MQMYVDDRRIDDESIEGHTLGDALRQVSSGLTQAHKIVAGVRCDGELIAADQMFESLGRPLSQFDKVEVITSTREALVIEVMTHAVATLEDSETQSQEVAKMLVEGRSAAARESLVECLQSWQQIHEAVAKSISMLNLDPQELRIRDEPLIDALARPRDVLTQIKDALLAGDEVLLADILQYEFADVTQVWHGILARLRSQAEDLRDLDKNP